MDSPAAHKISAAADLIRLSKQYGTLLVLMPTLWALFIAAQGTPPLKILLVFMAGAFLMRSAGCVINDIADRNIDGHVARTRLRPLPSGRLSVSESVLIFFILVALALFLAFQLNPLARVLSLGGVLLAVAYPFFKRVFPLPQVIMGAAFGWGSIMAWAAVKGTLDYPVILIFMANLFWATAYDTIYALMDRDDDVRIGVKSSAILFGAYTWAAVGLLFGMSLVFFLLLGRTTGLGSIYYGSLGIAAGWFLYQAWAIRRPLERAVVFSLFKSNVLVGLLVLIGLVLNYHL